MNQPYILLLENDSHDRELTLEYFGKSEVSIGIEFLTYSNEVVPYLKNAETLPALILLRINAVPQTGLEVLKAIKANAGFKHIPVVILGENTQPNLVNECMAAGAASVINKPFTYALTDAKINAFIQYWFKVVELPSAKVEQLQN